MFKQNHDAAQKAFSHIISIGCCETSRSVIFHVKRHRYYLCKRCIGTTISLPLGYLATFFHKDVDAAPDIVVGAKNDKHYR